VVGVRGEVEGVIPAPEGGSRERAPRDDSKPSLAAPAPSPQGHELTPQPSARCASAAQWSTPARGAARTSAEAGRRARALHTLPTPCASSRYVDLINATSFEYNFA
jgi:hypothetical protein